jgi:heme/copper-type cytochrome/quinol oxidase subunit 2
MYCGHCGNTINAGESFCSSCGTAVVSGQTVAPHFVHNPPATSLCCSKCGSANVFEAMISESRTGCLDILLLILLIGIPIIGWIALAVFITARRNRIVYHCRNCGKKWSRNLSRNRVLTVIVMAFLFLLLVFIFVPIIYQML